VFQLRGIGMEKALDGNSNLEATRRRLGDVDQ